jgi:predicted aspartyl protease
MRPRKAGYGSRRIYAEVSINSSIPVRFMVDTDADVSILSTASAKLIKLDTSRPQGTHNLIGVTGGGDAPLINVAMKIQTVKALSLK